MEHDFWQERWEKQQIGFHQSEVNPRLVEHIEVLPPAPSRVLVPLCGKSKDMTWLAERGHQVVGVELAERAVQDYFAERTVEPEVTTQEPYQCYAHDNVQLLCGDFFAIEQRHTGSLDAVYDRAALIALPDEMRSRYVERVTSLLAPSTPYLLLVLELPQHERPGPPFSIERAEVDRLFAANFTITEHSRVPLEPMLGGIELSSLSVTTYEMIKKG